MEQNLLSGIGNIYASEILFLAKIHPLRVTQTLSYQETEKLLNLAQTVLKKAVVLGGTSIVDFVNPLNQAGQYQKELKIYGRTGQPCFSCAQPVKQIKINQRSSFFCSHCQV